MEDSNDEPSIKKAKRVSFAKTSYADRTNNGTLMIPCYGQALSKRPLWVDLGTRNDASRVTVSASRRANQRFMFTPLNERCRALGVDEEDDVFVGRVCVEGLTGKLNKHAVCLDMGARVHLDLSKINSYSVFPGQRVRVKGSLFEGVLTAEALEPVPLAPLMSVPLQKGPVTIWVAAGPFTTTDNLDYAPLQDLLRAARTSVPDVLILCGPFVDMEHPAVKSNRLEVTENGKQEVVDAHTLFMLRVAWKLNLEPTKIVLVPSPHCALSDFVFPTPPLKDLGLGESSWDSAPVGGLDIPEAVVSAANPSTVDVDELKVAVTALDVLFELSKEEKSQNCTDRVPRLASHLLEQRSFYPLFPSSAPVDLKQDLAMDTPDILIVPSKLGVFVKDIGPTLVVNPGSLAKGQQGGAYAEITVHPRATSDVPLLHDTPNRSRVEIIRI